MRELDPISGSMSCSFIRLITETFVSNFVDLHQVWKNSLNLVIVDVAIKSHHYSPNLSRICYMWSITLHMLTLNKWRDFRERQILHLHHAPSEIRASTLSSCHHLPEMSYDALCNWDWWKILVDSHMTFYSIKFSSWWKHFT